MVLVLATVVVANIPAAARAFAGRKPAHDDLTVCAVRL